MKFSHMIISIVWASSPLISNAFMIQPNSLNSNNMRAFQPRTPTCLFETESTIEHLPQSAVELTVTAPGTATKAAYDKACVELSQNIEIPGFRKGAKIPAQVLEQVIRQRNEGKGGKHPLRAQAITTLINQLVEPTLKKNDLDPIGQPTMVVPLEEMVESFQPGEELTIKVRCDVWPELKWKQSTDGTAVYKGLKGSYTRKPFNQVKLDKALSDLKERYASLDKIVDTSHTLQMGDACVVNMEGFMANPDGTKGEPLPNAASGDRVEVVLGQGRYMEGLVEGLIGAKTGDTVQVSVAFPEVSRILTSLGQFLSAFLNGFSLYCSQLMPLATTETPRQNARWQKSHL
jgi:trigger factor